MFLPYFFVFVHSSINVSVKHSRLILQLRNAKLGPTDQFLMTLLCVGTFLADTRQINILLRNTKKARKRYIMRTSNGNRKWC